MAITGKRMSPKQSAETLRKLLSANGISFSWEKSGVRMGTETLQITGTKAFMVLVDSEQYDVYTPGNTDYFRYTNVSEALRAIHSQCSNDK